MLYCAGDHTTIMLTMIGVTTQVHTCISTTDLTQGKPNGPTSTDFKGIACWLAQGMGIAPTPSFFVWKINRPVLSA